MDSSNNSKEFVNNPQEDKTYNLDYIYNFIKSTLDLRKGVDKMATINDINSRIHMSGANAWMLMCSIMIASIGLDRNSDAVIIGAMLISPLMSPILGIGLGIAVNDKEIVKKSFFNFSVAIFIAILFSTLYFLLTPFGTMNPSIFSRTQPNTLDVLVAIFGGLAGIISIARKDLSTTLPGVAIATALMPPLCVTGYGLASAEWNVALNSFYLFTMNTCFIVIATYVIIRYLKFPYKKFMNAKERKRNRIIVFIVALLVVIPSFLILNNVLLEERSKAKVIQVLNQQLDSRKIYLDEFIIDSDSTKTLVLKVYGKVISEKDIPRIKEGLASRGLESWDVKIVSSSDVNSDELDNLATRISDVRLLTQRELNLKEERLVALQNYIVADSTLYSDILEELKITYPEVEFLFYGKMQPYKGDSKTEIPSFLVRINNEDIENEKILEKVTAFLKVRLKRQEVQVIPIDS